jgi:hypothetical protein
MITKFNKYLKVYESPEYIRMGSSFVDIFEQNSYPFGIYEGKMYVSKDTTHNYILPDIKSYTKTKREILQFPGRIWLNQKVISFWKYPPKSEMKEVIIKLENAFKEQLNKEVRIWEDEDFKIEIEKSDLAPLSAEKLIPLKQFVGSSERTPEELRQQHVLSPMLKTNKIKPWHPKNYIPLEIRQKMYAESNNINI